MDSTATGQVLETSINGLNGLPIRLGIYLYMLTCVIAWQFSSAIGSSSTNGLDRTTFAMVFGFTAGLTLDISLQTIQTVEVVPVLALILAMVRVCRVDCRKKGIKTFIFTAELVALAALLVYFALYSVDSLPKPANGHWAVFVWARTSSWNQVRTTIKMVCILLAFACLVAVKNMLSLALGRDSHVNRLRGRPLALLGHCENDEWAAADSATSGKPASGRRSEILLIAIAIIFVETWLIVYNFSNRYSAGSISQLYILLCTMMKPFDILQKISQNHQPSDVFEDEKLRDRGSLYGSEHMYSTRDRGLDFPTDGHKMKLPCAVGGLPV